MYYSNKLILSICFLLLSSYSAFSDEKKITCEPDLKMLLGKFDPNQIQKTVMNKSDFDRIATEYATAENKIRNNKLDNKAFDKTKASILKSSNYSYHLNSQLGPYTRYESRDQQSSYSKIYSIVNYSLGESHLNLYLDKDNQVFLVEKYTLEKDQSTTIKTIYLNSDCSLESLNFVNSLDVEENMNDTVSTKVHKFEPTACSLKNEYMAAYEEFKTNGVSEKNKSVFEAKIKSLLSREGIDRYPEGLPSAALIMVTIIGYPKDLPEIDKDLNNYFANCDQYKSIINKKVNTKALKNWSSAPFKGSETNLK